MQSQLWQSALQADSHLNERTVGIKASYYNNRGNVYRCIKDYKRAIVDHNRAIELNPTYPWA